MAFWMMHEMLFSIDFYKTIWTDQQTDRSSHRDLWMQLMPLQTLKTSSEGLGRASRIKDGPMDINSPVLDRTLSAKGNLNKGHKANNASSWWQNNCIMTWLHEIILDLLSLWLVEIDIHGCVTHRWTGRPSYRYAKVHLEGLVYLLWQYFAQKCLFPLFFTKAWRTDRPMDGRRDGQTRL